MVRYRRRLEIIADILNAASVGIRKTQLMYQSNLNYSVLEKYLTKIMKVGLLRFNPEERSYVITEKGTQFLQTYKEYRKTDNAAKRRLDDVNSQMISLKELCQDIC